MKKANKQEKKCSNCPENDEQQIQIQRQIMKQKAENDSLVRQLKQLGEESKKLIENLVVSKPQQPQVKPELQEEVNRKQMEIAKKQLETVEKRIKVLEKKEEEMTYEEIFELVKKSNETLEESKQKNQELKRLQREQDKILLKEKFAFSRNDVRKEIEILTNRITLEQKSLQKKQENKEKLIKKMEEIEVKHKEVCSQFKVQPLTRPDFSAPPPDQKFSPQRKDLSKQTESVSSRQKVQSASKPRTAQTERVSSVLVLQAKDNVTKIKNSILSFGKSHAMTMGDLQQREDTLLTQKNELEKELEILSQECAKAQAALKELQKVPKDTIIESSKPKGFSTELPSSEKNNESVLIQEEQTAAVDSKTLMQNKNKYKRELQGTKLITDHASLWADYNTLPGERNYKMISVKFFSKDLDILRIEIEYQLISGEIQLSAQPPQSDEVLSDKEVKVVNIRLARNEHFTEVSGLQDSSRITLLKIRTSQYNDYQVGLARFSIKQKEFKFSILPIEKPISIFGCFDISKTHGKKVLAQLGIELARKEIIGEQKKLQQLPNKQNVSPMKGQNIEPSNINS